jgi:transaldolase
VRSLADLKIQLYADGADVAQMIALNQHALIKGFTTNPSLCLRAGVTYYEKFIRDTLAMIPDKPISFEVLADDLKEMERQARKLAPFGPNVFVKIPITTTTYQPTAPLIARLAADGIRVNVTAVMTMRQVDDLIDCFAHDVPAIVSIFAGRIADTGINAGHEVGRMARLIHHHAPHGVSVLWASTRQLWNIFEANEVGCDVITVTMDQITKLALIGKDLTEYSRETVQQFYDDGRRAGLLL